MTSAHEAAAGSAPGVASPERTRWAWAEIDLDAIRHNVATLRAAVSPSGTWAVVKANGYGHGAVEVARAALSAGAEGLCVALVQEGVELRQAGIDAPILVLSQQPPEQSELIVTHRLTPTLYELDRVVEFAAVVGSLGRVGYPVQVKVDTGMHRVGSTVNDAASIVAAIDADAPLLRLAGVFTHLACADEPQRSETGDQLDRFSAALATLPARPPMVHAANSAGGLAHPRARHDIVRLGIAIYGIEPGPDVADLCGALRPALSLRARVGFVKTVQPGAAVSYGGRWTADRPTVVATLPLGYADGLPRRLGSCGGEVLIGGTRRPIIGSVTMDQIVIDCGSPDETLGRSVAVGDEVVLIGEQGGERIRAEEWARKLDTIPYEIVCGISPRIERHYRSTIE
jgi:alanine racemase